MWIIWDWKNVGVKKLCYKKWDNYNWWRGSVKGNGKKIGKNNGYDWKSRKIIKRIYGRWRNGNSKRINKMWGRNKNE
jgi:hypothetical protein